MLDGQVSDAVEARQGKYIQYSKQENSIVSILSKKMLI